MNDRTEPSADIRQGARALWELFVALTREGFTEQQALVIIGTVMAQNGSADQ